VTTLRAELAARLAAYDSLVEVGIGDRPEVAATLAEAGVDVTAVDVADVETPPGVTFVNDDIVASRDALGGGSPEGPYRVDAIYGLNLPAELQRPARDLARAAAADLWFTTLGFEQPVVPAERESVKRETLYVDRRDDGSDG
jgi:uncharacterized UPF0146 family protein